jgi:hypothetical protein
MPFQIVPHRDFPALAPLLKAFLAGGDFLHWKAVRPARVLFVDGEMPRRLVKTRIADAARRLGTNPTNLYVLCRDDIDEMCPLNTAKGQAFIERIIKKIGGVDFIIFDNVQSLIVGDMKDELAWQETLPWIKSLTRRAIGQMWVHHTGLNESRAYGTSTREWQMCTVAIMEEVKGTEADIAFKLKFSKKRMCTPDNRADFETATITLSLDQWASERDVAVSKPNKMPSPKARAFYKALVAALATMLSRCPCCAARNRYRNL